MLVYKGEHIIDSAQAVEIHVAGGERVLNFCANNCLGLAAHPRVRMGEAFERRSDLVDDHVSSGHGKTTSYCGGAADESSSGLLLPASKA